MSRLAPPATIDAAPEASRPLLEQVKAKFGMTSNLYRLLALSPAALEGYLGLSGALAKASLDARTRERIALTVANVNGCDYCNAAHGAIAAKLRLSADDIAAARRGTADEPKTAALLAFARKVALTRAGVDDADLATLRAAGVSDAELVEIVVLVALNVLTNYVNIIFDTPLDFPAAAPATRA